MNNIKNDYKHNKINEQEHINNIKEEYIIDVLTDSYQLWISAEDFYFILNYMTSKDLVDFKFKKDTDVEYGKSYYQVEQKFIDYVYNNIKYPRFKFRLNTMRVMERSL